MNEVLEQAAQLAKLKDEFVFIASHELRTPVTSMKWNISLALKDPEIEKLSFKSREYLLEVQRAAQRLAMLVGDVLNVSRFEAGTVRIAFVNTSVKPPLDQALEVVRPLVAEKGISLQCDAAAIAALPEIRGDPMWMREVFTNLLSNGVKYNMQGGSVEVLGAQEDQSIVLRFKDSGLGLSPKDQESLFKKFWRAHHEIEGTGLGLWIVKQIVERMHGTITVESAEGQGSTFTLRFPVAQKESAA